MQAHPLTLGLCCRASQVLFTENQLKTLLSPQEHTQQQHHHVLLEELMKQTGIVLLREVALFTERLLNCTFCCNPKAKSWSCGCPPTGRELNMTGSEMIKRREKVNFPSYFL